MSKTILVMGESGSGKTTSMRNLPPNETFYIDCDKKGLSWKGWREQYSTEKQNYMQTSETKKVMTALTRINQELPQIKYVVIDTLNWIMIDDEFKRMNEKGYDKWQDMAYSIIGIVSLANILRDDLTVIFVMHSQTEKDETTGATFTRAKTSGQKINKIGIESKFTTVLLAKNVDGKYIFETTSNNSTAKAPMGAFETNTIDNDMMKVIEALKDF